jgi:hypothetical protein
MLMVIAAVVVAVIETYKLKSPVPAVAFGSAALWLPNEPFIDAILGFQYAKDSPVILFTLWGRVIPLEALGYRRDVLSFPVGDLSHDAARHSDGADCRRVPSLRHD